MLTGKVPVYFAELYPRLYPVIALCARGKFLDWWIYKQYGSFKVMAKLYYPEQPRTGRQQGQKSLFYDAVKNWQGFDVPAKQYYNALKRPNVMSGYNRYLKFYLEANYPMIIYWEPLVQSSSENLTIPEYFAESYFAGVQRFRSLNAYPSSTPYGAVIYHLDFARLFVFYKDIGWTAIGTDTLSQE